MLFRRAAERGGQDCDYGRRNPGVLHECRSSRITRFDGHAADERRVARRRSEGTAIVGDAAPRSLFSRRRACLGAAVGRGRKSHRDFATGFNVDHTYSQDKPDERMERSFGVSWDRVQPSAWSLADEKAVLDHQSMLYVPSPPMTSGQRAATVSTAALLVVDQLIKAFGVDLWRKGRESAALARWPRAMERTRTPGWRHAEVQ